MDTIYDMNRYVSDNYDKNIMNESEPWANVID